MHFSDLDEAFIYLVHSTLTAVQLQSIGLSWLELMGIANPRLLAGFD